MINICFSCNDNYIQHLTVAIASLLKNNPDKDFNLYLLDGSISLKNKNKIKKLKKIKSFNIEFISVDVDKFKNCPVPEGSHFSIEACFRFLIPEVFANLDKILYLDCDLVILKDISEIYNINLADNYIAMAQDADYEISLKRLDLKGDAPYCNSGVTLFNIQKCNEDNLTQKLFEWTAQNKEKLLYPDQDALNVVCRERILKLPWKSNAMVRVFDFEQNRKLENYYDEIIIMHYIGMGKPWNDKNCHVLYKPYFHYLKYTPWKMEYYKRKIAKFIFRKDDETKKIKIFKLTIAQTISEDDSYKILVLGLNIYERKKNGDKKQIKILSIPIIELKENKWKKLYHELEDSILSSEQIKTVNSQLESLEAIKILKKVQK